MHFVKFQNLLHLLNLAIWSHPKLRRVLNKRKSWFIQYAFWKFIITLDCSLRPLEDLDLDPRKLSYVARCLGKCCFNTPTYSFLCVFGLFYTRARCIPQLVDHFLRLPGFEAERTFNELLVVQLQLQEHLADKINNESTVRIIVILKILNTMTLVIRNTNT